MVGCGAAAFGTSGTTRLTIDGNGNVGIGTTAQTYPLDVRTTTAGVAINVISTVNGYGVFSTVSHAGGVAVRGINSNTGADGALGYSTYGVYCLAGTCGGANAWTTPSDIRLKEHIEMLDSREGLAAIMKLRPVMFRWKDRAHDEEKGRQYGFIAQEMEKVFPEMVVTTKGMSMTITLSDGTSQTVIDPKTMDYSSVVVPLTKAVQELKAANDNVVSETAALKIAREGDAVVFNQETEDLRAQRKAANDNVVSETAALRAQLKAANDNAARLEHRLERLERAAGGGR